MTRSMTFSADELDRDLIARALDDGALGARRELVQALAPVVQVRVGRLLVRRFGRAATARMRAELEDLVQEVFVQLFADEGRRLRAWDPERAPAGPFFGLVAERIAMNLLASRTRKPWMDEATDPADLSALGGGRDDRARHEARATLGRLLARVDAELSPREQTLFQLIYVEQAEPAAVGEALGMSTSAVYQAKRRLRLRIKSLARGLEA